MPLKLPQHVLQQKNHDRQNKVGQQKRQRTLHFPCPAQLQQTQCRQQRDHRPRVRQLQIEMITICLLQSHLQRHISAPSLTSLPPFPSPNPAPRFQLATAFYAPFSRAPTAPAEATCVCYQKVSTGKSPKKNQE